MPISLRERLEKKMHMEPNTGCWLWVGAKNLQGYGRAFFDGKLHQAHRLMFSLIVGPVPVEMELDHLCRQPACINPKHLEVVTHLENMRRAPRWQKRITRCANGHEFDGIGSRQRWCRICKRANWRRWKERKLELA